jgi:hypothetical protein
MHDLAADKPESEETGTNAQRGQRYGLGRGRRGPGVIQGKVMLEVLGRFWRLLEAAVFERDAREACVRVQEPGQNGVYLGDDKRHDAGKQEACRPAGEDVWVNDKQGQVPDQR